MTATVPVRSRLSAHQAEVSLVDQRRRLQRLAGLFLRQLLRRQVAQLVIYQRQELIRGGRIALLDGRQDARDLTHRRPQLARWLTSDEYTRRLALITGS